MDSIRVRAELLPIGISLWQPVRDEQDRVLLKAGSLVTAELKQSLIAQQIEWVMLHPDDAMQVMGVDEATEEDRPRPLGRSLPHELRSASSRPKTRSMPASMPCLRRLRSP